MTLRLEMEHVTHTPTPTPCILSLRMTLLGSQSDLIATPMEVVKKIGVKYHFTILNSILASLNSIFVPMLGIKIGCHFNN